MASKRTSGQVAEAYVAEVRNDDNNNSNPGRFTNPRRDKHWRNRKKKYYFDLRDTERWFDVMLANGTLTLPETNSQTQPGDELSSRYCRYHRRLNHGTSYCNALPYIFHERISRGELKYDNQGSPTTMIETQPLPNHNDANLRNPPVATVGAISVSPVSASEWFRSSPSSSTEAGIYLKADNEEASPSQTSENRFGPHSPRSRPSVPDEVTVLSPVVHEVEVAAVQTRKQRQTLPVKEDKGFVVVPPGPQRPTATTTPQENVQRRQRPQKAIYDVASQLRKIPAQISME